jgi:hypothetical protein
MSEKLTEAERASFWRAVALCLVEFAGYEHDVAERAVVDLRARLEAEGPEVLEIALHDEPINIAADIFGKEIDIQKFEKEYEAILDEALAGA